MEKLKMQTADMAERNIEMLGQMFPNCLTETINADGKLVRAIDFDKLRQELACEVVEGAEERYQFTWPDKRVAIRLANAPTNKTLRPCREESVNFDNTENLYIEGDNLEVLKLLRENYLGKVKMIYIDPPYNTGNDFVYNDDFAQGKAEFEAQSGLFDEEGRRMADPMVQNTESNGRFHTDWLNMIYPRLKVAKDLLTDDGVIFISIDDNEVENLRKVCDEIFGEQNFVDALHWKKKKQPSFLARHTAKVMEYVIVYAKSKWDLEKLSIETLSDATKKVINISNPECIRHFKAGVRVKLGDNGVVQKGRYRIKTMDVEYLSDIHYVNGYSTTPVDVKARFSVGQSNIDKYIDENLLFITANYGLRRDVSEEEKNNRKSITDLLLSEYGDNQESDKEFLDLFDSKYFDYTKPIALIYNFIKSNYTQEQYVLDFFSGSATTAHAVMQLNAEDGGNRKFIMVQLPELTYEGKKEKFKDSKGEEHDRFIIDETTGYPVIVKDSDARKAGYWTIPQIGKERIRRAGKKVKEEAGLQGQNLDTGFRVLKLDESNMADVYYTPAETPIQQTLDFDKLVDNIREGRTAEDLLFQVLPECNLPLSSKIEIREIHGKKVFVVNDGYLMACFDKDINEAVITAIAKEKPYYFVMCDRSIATDNVADNFDQIFNAYSKETVRRIL